MGMTRRGLLKTTLAAGVVALRVRMAVGAEELKLPNDVPTQTFDFDSKGIQGWTTVDGQWVVEDMAGAPVGKKVLIQKATKNAFNVIVAPPGPYSDVDISVKFDPLSGKEDASGGIVFRFNDGKYYVVRANALEDNVRFYRVVKGTREQLAGADTKVSAKEWHTLGIRAESERFSVSFHGKLLFTASDKTFADPGKVALWTKADSVTRFDAIEITPLP